MSQPWLPVIGYKSQWARLSESWNPDLICDVKALPSSWWMSFHFLIPSHPLFWSMLHQKGWTSVGFNSTAQRHQSANPFRPEKHKTLVKKLNPIPMRSTSTAAAQLNESFKQAHKAGIMAHGGIAQPLVPLKGVQGFSTRDSVSRVDVFYWWNDGCCVFIFLLRPTDKVQAEGFVMSSVKMCEIIFVFVVLQCEDTWQMLLCSDASIFFFLSLCPSFLIALVFAEWAEKGECVVNCSYERPSIYLNAWLWLLNFKGVRLENWQMLSNCFFKDEMPPGICVLLCGWILWNLLKILCIIFQQNLKTKEMNFIFGIKKSLCIVTLYLWQ